MPRSFATMPPWSRFATTLATSGALLLAACGGGTAGTGASDANPVPSTAQTASTAPQAPPRQGATTAPQAAPTAVPQTLNGQLATPPRYGSKRGLHNLGNNCAIASTVQLLMHDADLREEAQHHVPQLQLDRLYAAYVSEHNTADKLDPIYQPGVVAPIRSLGFDTVRKGAWLDLLNLWTDPKGLGLPLTYVHSFAEVHLLREYGGQRIFALLPPPDAPHLPIPGVHKDTIPAYTSFADLPEPEAIQGLIYDTGGHYMAYIRVDDEWWRFNDAAVSRVEAHEMQRLQASGRRGIALVVYQPWVP